MPRSLLRGYGRRERGDGQLRALTRQADARERQRPVLVKGHRLQLVAEIGRGRHHAASAAGVLLTGDDAAAEAVIAQLRRGSRRCAAGP